MTSTATTTGMFERSADFAPPPDAATAVLVAPADSAATVELLVKLVPELELELELLDELLAAVVDPQDEVVGVLVAKPTIHGN